MREEGEGGIRKILDCEGGRGGGNPSDWCTEKGLGPMSTVVVNTSVLGVLRKAMGLCLY